MAMMTLIDLPSNKVQLRHDIYHDYEVCFSCKGTGYGRTKSWGNLHYDGFMVCRTYRCCGCGGCGYVRKDAAA